VPLAQTIDKSEIKILNTNSPAPIQKIAVIGLGYVGLPLAVALAKNYQVTGFDISLPRLEELKNGFDRTGEIDEASLRSSSLHLTSDAMELKDCQVFIVTVPTPVTQDNTPDLTPLEKASLTVGPLLKKGDIVCYESTVYPGVTEDFCAPILEKASSFKSGQDFFLGYSPERINPGDKVHTVDKITKIVSGQTPAVAETLRQIYGSMNGDNIFVAKSIKTAEAAKVIENTQRDINIAFINEITQIFHAMDVGIYDVLEAAGTKWNFLPFQPGLVGGHCIGVDPYYLATAAKALNIDPKIILAGRRINEDMSAHIAQRILNQLNGTQQPRVLVLGLTFKENVPDLRNTKIIDLILHLKEAGIAVDVHDAYADAKEAKAFFGIDLITHLEGLEPYHCVVGAVAHEPYRALSPNAFVQLIHTQGTLFDLKNMWSTENIPENISYQTL